MSDNNDLEGICKDENGIVQVDTKVWKRPTTIAEDLQDQGVDVSTALVHSWKKSGKVVYKELRSLRGLTLINVLTLPTEFRLMKTVSIGGKDKD